ncbi:MAG: hypothetical protein IJ629_00910 [Clostridia bacterium]|nr:hypothetical protein [Clostridia bacterium]
MKKIDFKKINLNNKKLLTLLIVIIVLIILLQSYIKIINRYRNTRIFALESEKYAKEVANPIFKVSRIVLYSGANVEDTSPDKNLASINVSQFTDFAIYIDNMVKDEELTEENTINRIYIDNIGIEQNTEGDGIKKFNTKSVQDLGKYVPILESSKEITYSVVHKNSDKELIEDQNRFYTDCSEPLVLSYVNENIIENKDVSNSGEKLSLDGSILRYLNIDLYGLNYKINFTINIENNLGEIFACNCSININLSSGDGDGIYSGYIMQVFDVSDGDFRFKKV